MIFVEMKIYILLITILVFSNAIFAQTGPGGVGETNGTSVLALWLDANRITLSNGSNVTTWTDLSGSSNTATAVSGNEPVFITNALNGMPTVRFTASNTDYLRVSDDPTLRPNRITVFVVGSYSNASSNYAPFVIKSNNFQNWDQGYGIARNNNTNEILGFVSDWNNNFVNSTLAYNTPTIMTMIYNQSNVNLRFNESSQGTDNYNTAIDNTINFLYLGISPNGTTGNGTGVQNPLNGDIYEVIIFRRDVNETERIIIHNYLAAKYNRTLSSNDIFDEDNSGNGDYDYDVAGIGRITASTSIDDAQGSGILRILNPQNLNNNEFLFWGHNNGLLDADEKTDVPPGVDARFLRVWRVSERNTNNTADVDVGNIDMRWDLNGIGPITASDLRLLIDTDNDGIFSDETPISGATHLGGGIYQFSNVPGSSGGIQNNTRFTLGTVNAHLTPLPIQLLYFNAILDEESKIKLDWQTAFELNNDYFSIERSKNGTDWELVTTIVGAGNSNTTLSYSITDNSPYNGVSYYRLKQTDFNGKSEYSMVQTVEIIKSKTPKIRAFPNPTNSQITVNGLASDLYNIRIFNKLGQDVSDYTTINYVDKFNYTIDLSNLPMGMYYIKSSTAATSIFKN